MSSTSAHRVEKTPNPQRTPTCDICKSRHQKCSGEQPQCSNCKLRGITCSYSNRRTTLSSRGAKRSPAGGGLSPKSPHSSISEADYNRLYAEIYGDIVRRIQLNGDVPSDVQQDILLDARPGNASLPNFNREVCSIVQEHVSRDKEQAAPQPDTYSFRERTLEQSSDYARKILLDSLPPQEIAIHLLDLFLHHHNSVLYVCNSEETRAQLALMYEDSSRVSISSFCQMFLIFSVGIQFDNVYDTDGAMYRELGQKYINDAIDENPQSTIWVMRAMLLLCFYEPPAKWNSVWMHLDTAIRGAQRFQLDMSSTPLKELPDNEYQEWRQIWLTIISFDRWVAIFLGRLPRIKESISRDPIFKNPFLGLEADTPSQNYVTSLAIISGNILRDMYFSEQASLKLCHYRKHELEKWMEILPDPFRQQIESGNIIGSPNSQDIAIFHLFFMRFGAWMLVTRPFLLKVVKMKTFSNFTGPIASAVVSEATLCIDYASRLINTATTLLGSSLAPKSSFMPVFFLINASHIMILAAVWRLKQNKDSQVLPMMYDLQSEFAAIDTSIQILESCGQGNSFARKYSATISDLRRQLNVALSNDVSLAPVSSLPSTGFPAVLFADSSKVMESPDSQVLNSPMTLSGTSTLGSARVSDGHGSLSSVTASNVSAESWLASQSGWPNVGNEESNYNPTASLLLSNLEDYNFWSSPGQ